MSPISDVEKRVKDIRRKTRRKYSAEDKIRNPVRAMESVGACVRISLADCPPNPEKIQPQLAFH